MKANKSECESVKEVMGRISHADLLSHYLGIDSLPVLINSPLRNDRHPSFFIYSPDGTRVLYRDYATGEKGDIYNLLQRRSGKSFSELIRDIAANKMLYSTTFDNHESKGKKFTKTTVDLKVKIREWQDYDIEYWESYGISLKWLKYAEVYPISHKIVYKNGNRYVFHAARLAYAFVERKEGTVSIKVYSPLATNKKLKWQSSMDASVWGLWTKIPKTGDNLIIGSSVKDCLNVWCNTGIPAICMQGEGYNPKPHIIEELKNRYKNIIVFFDNDFEKEDNPGRSDSIRLAKAFNLKRIEIPDSYKAKDPSDLYKKFGKEKYLEIMHNLLEPVLWKSGEK